MLLRVVVHDTVKPLTHTLEIGTKREAQLSQRNRAMFPVIEYFAKSFKVTEMVPV